MDKKLLERLGITNESITDEELVSLVLGEKDKLKNELDKNKELISKRNSEIADYKRKEDAKKTDEEKHKEYVSDLEKKYADLQRKSSISDIKSKYLSMGYDDTEADKIASASLDNKYDLVAKYIGEHTEKVKEQLKADLLKNAPKPTNIGGGEPNKEQYFTKENYRAGKIKFDDLCKLANENKELYENITAKD